MRGWNRDHTSRLVRSLSPTSRTPSSNPFSSFSSTMEGNMNPIVNPNQNLNLKPILNPNLNQNPNPNLIINEDNDPLPLRKCSNPTRNVEPSCIILPLTNANHFEIKPGLINMLPKFSGTEDPYLFIR